MKNPLIKRLPRELKGEIGKYIVLFLFITMMIGTVSGFLVAAGSMSVAYDESFEKYNIESGNFELLQKADDDAIKKIEDGEEKIKVYENFYLDKETKEVDSTIRLLLTVLYLLDSIITVHYTYLVDILTIFEKQMMMLSRR